MDGPTTFGKYYLTEKLATGGMGEIYHGKLLGPGGFEKQLVIEQIHRDLASRREFVELFVAEAKTMVSLSHGNIVPVYELGVVGGTYFIAMEYVAGPTLVELARAARHRKRRLGAPYAAFIVAEILKGLDYAHRKAGGVVHRDLSPRNVMVSRDGEVKILDFGLAATLEAAAQADARGARPAGSFPYMSPEQARREPLDARTDVFSAGVLLWELLTGGMLFARGEDDATLEAVRSAEIAPPSKHAPEVPAELDAACLRALERDLDRRWPGAAEFQAALGRYLYTVEPALTQTALAKLVAEVCPEVPRQSSDSSSSVSMSARASVSAADSNEGAHATKPMVRSPSQAELEAAVAAAARTPSAPEEIFATHVELERALERSRGLTPMIGVRAIPDLASAPVKSSITGRPAEEPALPPGGVASVAASAAPPRLTRRMPLSMIIILLLVTAGAAAWVVRASTPRKTVAPPVNPHPVAGPALDAGVPAAAIADAAPAPALPPDAGKRVVAPPVAMGKVNIGALGVAWAKIYIDGKDKGVETPRTLTLPAGPHKVRLYCVPEVCPPVGRERSMQIDVPANGETKAILDLSR